MFTVKAVDNALAMNAKFRYSILRQFPFAGNFTLNENTGLVTLNGSLDRKLTRSVPACHRCYKCCTT